MICLKDTESFIESHTERLALNDYNMKAAAAKLSSQEKPMQDASAKLELSLEDAWNDAGGEGFFSTAEKIVLEPLSSPWVDNDGTMPGLPEETLVDVMFVDGGLSAEPSAVECWEWSTHGQWGEIAKWRFHKPSDTEYYKQPKTANRLLMEASFDPESIPVRVADEPSIDSHYNFTYKLSQSDIDTGTLKIDPYFVSQQWQLGSKDSTGVIFHTLKTLARFGDKNTKEREITALYKQVVRLAQLEGVTL